MKSVRNLLTIFLVSLSLLACSSDYSSSPPPPAPSGGSSGQVSSPPAAIGQWAGEGIVMMVTASGATYNLSCAQGTIDQPIVGDSSGNFHLTGTNSPGAANTRVPPPAPNPAIYEGVLNGNDMTLTITVTEGGMTTSNTFHLQFGAETNLIQCL